MTVTIDQLQDKSNAELLAEGYRWWDGQLMLIPLRLYENIADGETLICIDGTTAVKGKDNIDLDIRGLEGLIAYGFYSLNQREK
jgi:hypothetical protein